MKNVDRSLRVHDRFLCTRQGVRNSYYTYKHVFVYSKLLNAFHRFLTWLTLLTAVFQTSAFLVQREALVAGVTFGQIARYAAHGTLQTFVAFLVRVIKVRAFRMARAFEFEITRLASYTLVLIRSGTRLALSIARATPKMIFKTRLIIKAFM